MCPDSSCDIILSHRREAEQAFELMRKEREPAARREALVGLGWDERLSAMAASLRQLAPVLAVSREVGEDSK